MEQSIFTDLIVLAKFYRSKAPNGDYNFISRTLGKISLVEAEDQEILEDQDIWLSRIIKEVKPNTNQGAFILKPLKKVEPKLIKKLIPGFYESKEVGNAVVIYPNENKELLWLISKPTREIFSRKFSSLIVPFQGNLDDVECLYQKGLQEELDVEEKEAEEPTEAPE